MSDPDPGRPGWLDRIRHWLWLDRTQRTDNSAANRGFYPGGLPVYLNRKPVGWRFVLPVVAAGVVIALLILAGRSAAAQPAEPGQRVVLDAPGFALTLPADWEVELREPWEEACGDTVWASAGRGGVWDGDQHCAFYTSRCLSANLVSYPPGHPETGADSEWLDLPAGRALYGVLTQAQPHTVVFYQFTRGVKDYVVACNAEEPPDDRWRSIAESFEFLRDELEESVPPPAVTLAFPDAWTVLEDRRQVTFAPGWASLLWASDGDSTCGLQSDTRLPRTGVGHEREDVHAAYRVWLGARGAVIIGSAEVELPVGRARRTDWALDWSEGQMPHSTYEFVLDGASLRFICMAISPPADRWYSLAATVTTVPGS